jgi:prepilin peptidase CpaA
VDKYLLICACAVAIAGAVTDARSRRIPNRLTLNAMAAALVTRALLGGWLGLKSGLLGIFAASGIFLLIFLMRGMAGGDVKLMAAVGAWAGSGQAIGILLAAALAGGVLAIYCVAFTGKLRQTTVNAFGLVRHHLSSGIRTHPRLNIEEAGTKRVPFGIAIALGTLFCAGNALLWR